MPDRLSYLRRYALLFLVCMIILYALFQARFLIEGPVIVIDEPGRSIETENHIFLINGSARNISGISLNDRPIFIDQAGHFAEKLILLPGYNIITLQGEDRFGRSTREVIEAIYIN